MIQRASAGLALLAILFAAAPARAQSATVLDRSPDADDVWQKLVYGFIELDGMHDSTQSFVDSANNNMVARQGTYAGDRGRMQATAKNSRLGLLLAAPRHGRIKATGQFELDFYGLQPSDATQSDYYVLGTTRVRHAYLKLETPVVDVLAGQYHDLFGWGGGGFYHNTLAFLGLPGQIYHRNAQLRLSKTLKRGSVEVDIAAAAVRPAQRDAEIPDVQAGVKLKTTGWTGVSAQGSGQPTMTAFSVGVSGVGRRFMVPEFLPNPRASYPATGWGLAANAVVPVIPVKSLDNRGNGLTVTAEFSTGTGIADLYTYLTGGARFPALPNPAGLLVPPIYPQNVDSGLVTFDADNNVKTYNWQAFTVGVQYYLPVAGGKVWISGVYAQIRSSNIVDLTPAANWGGIFKKSEYFDGNLFVAITPAVQLALSFQSTQQTFGDGVAPRNLRGEIGLLFFF